MLQLVWQELRRDGQMLVGMAVTAMAGEGLVQSMDCAGGSVSAMSPKLGKMGTMQKYHVHVQYWD